MCIRIYLQAGLLTHLLRKLYEHRLVIDISFVFSAEVSHQRRFRKIRSYTLCCCFGLLLLLSFQHQRRRRRFAPSSFSIDCCCPTNCIVAICIRSTWYTVRMPSIPYVVLCSAACCCTSELLCNVLLCLMADINVFFPSCFQRFFSFHSKLFFILHPLAVLSH